MTTPPASPALWSVKAGIKLMGRIYQRAAGSWKAVSRKDVWEQGWQMQCCLTPQQQQVHGYTLGPLANRCLAQSMNKHD